MADASADTLTIVMKTLKGQKLNLTVNLGETVGQMKQQIENDLKLGEAAGMKLIHHGKILKDEQALTSLGLKEKDIVVVMTKKKKPKKAPVQASTQQTAPPAQSTPAQTTTQPAQTQAQPAQTQNSDSAPAQTSSDSQENSGANALVTGNQMEDTIANLMAMGFPRSECEAALRAAFNNPDRAVEYLLTGIPSNVSQAPPQQARPAQAQGAPAQAQRSQGAAPGMGAQQQNQLLSQLLRNPQMLNAVLQEISTIRPEAYQQIVSNMQANPQGAVQQFATLLNDPQVLQLFMSRMLMGQVGAGMQGQMGQGMGQQGGQGGPAPGQQVVQLTQEEAAGITQLTSMGFSQEQAVRAYIAANRNLDAAASLLFESDAFRSAPAQPAQAQQPAQANPPAQAQANNNEEAAQDANNNQEAENMDVDEAADGADGAADSNENADSGAQS